MRRTAVPVTIGGLAAGVALALAGCGGGGGTLPLAKAKAEASGASPGAPAGATPPSSIAATPMPFQTRFQNEQVDSASDLAAELADGGHPCNGIGLTSGKIQFQANSEAVCTVIGTTGRTYFFAYDTNTEAQEAGRFLANDGVPRVVQGDNWVIIAGDSTAVRDVESIMGGAVIGATTGAT